MNGQHRLPWGWTVCCSLSPIGLWFGGALLQCGKDSFPFLAVHVERPGLDSACWDFRPLKVPRSLHDTQIYVLWLDGEVQSALEHRVPPHMDVFSGRHHSNAPSMVG